MQELSTWNCISNLVVSVGLRVDTRLMLTRGTGRVLPPKTILGATVPEGVGCPSVQESVSAADIRGAGTELPNW